MKVFQKGVKLKTTNGSDKNMIEIIIALITGVCSVVGVIITTSASSRKLQQQLEVNQAVVNTKIENLTEEVRKHNNFTVRVPILEEQVATIQEEIKELKRRIEGA